MSFGYIKCTTYTKIIPLLAFGNDIDGQISALDDVILCMVYNLVYLYPGFKKPKH
jgi:hypothetical protein